MKKCQKLSEQEHKQPSCSPTANPPVLQKRVIRIITKSEPYVLTTHLFYEYGLLDIMNIHLLRVCLFMFLFSKKLSPKSFHSMFQKSSEIHSYITRNASNYRPHKCRTNTRKYTISCQGSTFWNVLPPDLGSKQSYYSFKVNLTKYLLHQ